MQRYILQITGLLPPLNKLPPITVQLNQLWAFAHSLEALNFPISHWYSAVHSPETALLNSAFDNKGPTTAAIALLSSEEKKNAAFRTIGIWNGLGNDENDDGGVFFESSLSCAAIPSVFRFESRQVQILKEPKNVQTVVHNILNIWHPPLIEVAPSGYFRKQVFKDRPGVGWMIYLPVVIKREQVPEAAEVIAVADPEQPRRQKGTIIVSTDEAFDASNPTHVKRANAIEIRLADQDLLPKRTDFLTIR